MRKILALSLIGCWLLAACQPATPTTTPVAPQVRQESSTPAKKSTQAQTARPGPTLKAEKTATQAAAQTQAAVTPSASRTPSAGEGPTPAASVTATRGAATATARQLTATLVVHSTRAAGSTGALPTLPVSSTPVKNIYGVHVYQLTVAKAVDYFRDSGALWSRTDAFKWNEIEPTRTDPPTYNWSIIDDAALRTAATAGMQSIGMILNAPEWARQIPTSPCGPYKESEIARFAAFAETLVARYSQPPFNIKYWEIGNEPDIDYTVMPQEPQGYGCWGDKTDPFFGGAYYGEMLKQVYPRLKAAAPDVKILVAGLMLDCDPTNPPLNANGQAMNCASGRFLEGILEAGGGDYFDGVSFHAYDYYFSVGDYRNNGWHSTAATNGSVLIPKTRYLRGLLQAYGYSNKLLINSENGILCGRDQSEPECATPAWQTAKAYYLAQSYAQAAAEHLDANIWYHLTGWRASQLVEGDYTAAPAYSAYQFSATMFAGAAFVREIKDYPDVQGYEFARSGQRIWILWAHAGQNTQVVLPEAPAAIYDVYGKAQAASQALTVGIAPLYVEFR